MFKIKTKLLLLLVSIKSLFVPFHDVPPTAEEVQAFEVYEDEQGYGGQYPSPWERYEMAVEWRDGMLEFSLVTLIRWRLAVAWMPFCDSERRLLGERISRKLFPNLWAIRMKRRVARRKAAA